MGTRTVSQSINLQADQTPKYITRISSDGITVHPEIQNSGSNYIHIDSNGLKIKNQEGSAPAISTDTELAGFTANGVQIGQTGETHTNIDYHSLQLKDVEGNSYFFVSDLRSHHTIDDPYGEGFYYVATESFIGNGITKVFEFSYAATNTTYPVTVDGTEVTSGITKEIGRFYFPTAPIDGAVITVEYATEDSLVKAYTAGLRKNGSKIGPMSFAEGERIEASGERSHAEGYESVASGPTSHAEGYQSIASGVYSHAEGRHTTASGLYSHAEGRGTKAVGDRAHAEGAMTTANGKYSHAEGYSTTTNGDKSHAEGHLTHADGECSHAEGYSTTADGNYSHAEGYMTLASGKSSHASGECSHAEGRDSFVIGHYNKEDDSCFTLTTDTTVDSSKIYYTYGDFGYKVVSDPTDENIDTYYEFKDSNGTYAFLIGNGNPVRRTNALTVDWSGNVDVNSTGGYSVGGTNILELVYPVGSIYMSVNSTDPGTLFGGTWVRLTDTFLLAAGSTYAADDGTHTTATGGASTVTLNEGNLPKHRHTYTAPSAGTDEHVLTVDEIPAHYHSMMYSPGSSSGAGWSWSGSTYSWSGATESGAGMRGAGGGKGHAHGIPSSSTKTGFTGSGTAHDNMPPYLTVYMWKRTA